MTQHAFSLAPAMLQELVSQSYPAPALYVLATPIGNAADITLRALQLLAMADAVACEDTRNTAQLLSRYGIQQQLIATHQHNEREAAERIIARLAAGERIVLVSDAGTPAVSDPGARVVDAALEAGMRVIPVPGASAAVTALSVSGLVNDHFHFHGFLPAKAKARDSELARLLRLDATLVLYEAPHRIVETVDALLRAFGPARRIVFARELTKLFEQMHRCALADAPAWLAADANRQRGEFVLLIEGMPARADEGEDMVEAERILGILLEECPVKSAAALAAKITGLKKNALYEMALRMKAERDEKG